MDNGWKNKELISVIVPVFNIEKYLPACLVSISEQSYQNLEIILVDDGSTDRSGSICDEYASKDSRVKVIHQTNCGLWAARNAGQDMAVGDYLFFPDGDDYFHRDLLQLLYEAINQDPKYDLAVAREKTVWDTSEDVTVSVAPNIIVKNKTELIQGLLAQGNDRFYVYMWNKLYRRRLIQDIRSQDYSRSQDYDFNIRAFLRTNKAVIVDNDLYYWLQHPGSLTKEKNSVIMMHRCRTRILFRNYIALSEDDASLRHLFLSRLYRTIALWKGRTIVERDYYSVKAECREYENVTRKAYLHETEIGVLEKAGCLLLIHSPRLTHLLMKITHNI
jgi:glycosyltransferase involved in cell wall biosynthesis